MKVGVTVERTGIAAEPARLARVLAREVGPRTAAFTERTKTRLRDDTRGPLGARMANTWRGKVYPVARPTKSLNPAGLVTSNASDVVAAFDPGGQVTARNARWLAIPTDAVPRGGRKGKRLSPVEVEAAFNQELDLVPSITRPGVFLLVLTARRGKRGIRQIKAKTAQAFWRQAERIPMFVLVPQVRLRKLLDWRKLLKEAEAGYAADIEAGVKIAILKAGAP